MDQKHSVKPPPFWADLRRRLAGTPQRLLILGVGVLVFVVLFYVLGNFINKVGHNTSSRNDGETANAMQKAPKNPFDEKELNQLGVLKLTEVVQFGDKLQEDIDKFESEAKYYHQHFSELLTSTKTGELQKYHWVIDYFKKSWDRRLPSLRVPGNYRHNLDILLKTIKEAIAKEKGYFPRQEVRDAINTIRKRVTEGELLYWKHNKLLDALLRSIGEGPQANPNTIQALVLKKEDELIEEEAKNTPWKDDTDNPMPFMPPAESNLLPRDITSPDGGAIDELYREEKQNRSKK